MGNGFFETQVSHVLRMGGPYYFSWAMASVWGCFWGIWAGQGLELARLGLGKFPRKLAGPRTKVRDVRIAWLDS